MAATNVNPELTDKPKKRKITGRTVEKAKKARLSSHHDRSLAETDSDDESSADES